MKLQIVSGYVRILFCKESELVCQFCKNRITAGDLFLSKPEFKRDILLHNNNTCASATILSRYANFNEQTDKLEAHAIMIDKIITE